MNVRTLAVEGASSTAKLDEIMLDLCDKETDIACLQETRIPGQGEGDDAHGYSYHFSGLPQTSKREYGVTIAIKESADITVVHREFISERIMWMAVNVRGVEIVVFAVYGPTEDGASENAGGAHFWDKLAQAVRRARDLFPNYTLVILGDFNGQINMPSNSIAEGCVGHVLLAKKTTANGLRLLDFCVRHGLQIANSFYTSEAGPATWRRPGAVQFENCIDYILVEDIRSVQLCGVDEMLQALIQSDHRALTMTCRLPTDLRPNEQIADKSEGKKRGGDKTGTVRSMARGEGGNTIRCQASHTSSYTAFPTVSSRRDNDR